MGRIYYAPLEISSNPMSVTTSATQDIWHLTAGSGDKCILHGFEITSASEVAEQVELGLVRRSTAGSGGTALTEVKRDETDSAPTAALVGLRTTIGTEGDVLHTYCWEQLGPLQVIFTPEMRPVIQESGIMALWLNSALAATTLWGGWVCWEEV